mmetsp:Transcript_4789/g.15027  ORF Transcript_4789/g.15027 Transcript_4789/m.15027 type:complete len:243 (-) Transcript_4789:7-735(-)
MQHVLDVMQSQLPMSGKRCPPRAGYEDYIEAFAKANTLKRLPPDVEGHHRDACPIGVCIPPCQTCLGATAGDLAHDRPTTRRGQRSDAKPCADAQDADAPPVDGSGTDPLRQMQLSGEQEPRAGFMRRKVRGKRLCQRLRRHSLAETQYTAAELHEHRRRQDGQHEFWGAGSTNGAAADGEQPRAGAGLGGTVGATAPEVLGARVAREAMRLATAAERLLGPICTREIGWQGPAAHTKFDKP